MGSLVNWKVFLLSAVIFAGISVATPVGRDPTKRTTNIIISFVAAIALVGGFEAAAKDSRNAKAVRERKDTPLHTAARTGSADALRPLLASADDANTRNAVGENLWHVALMQEVDLKNKVPLLIEFCVDVNAVTMLGLTPLHLAASTAGEVGTHVVDALLRARADVNAICDHPTTLGGVAVNGWPALHFAAKVGNLDSVKRLLVAGARADTLDADKKTAEQVARRHGHAEIARLLAQPVVQRDEIGQNQ